MPGLLGRSRERSSRGVIDLEFPGEATTPFLSEPCERKKLAVAKYLIKVATELCSGCLRCELGCSEAQTKAFNPSAARIQVTMTGSNCEVRFTEDCVECGICADHCFFGALSKTKREEDEK